MRGALIWALLLGVASAALWLAATSPLLQWRDPIYIAGGFAGVLAMALMVFQPLFAAGRMPGIALHASKRLHRIVGPTILLGTLIHVGALWITSPPDVMDALLFASPAPFAVWGVLGMWALIATAGLALMRKKLGLRRFRRAHGALALFIAGASVLHAVQIVGTMETISKALLSAALLGATLFAVLSMRAFAPKSR